MNAFGRFCNSFLKFIEGARLNVTESFGGGRDDFINELGFKLNNCMIFEVDDKVRDLLLLTDPPKNSNSQRLPYGHMFIDVTFTKEELIKFGIEHTYPIIYGILLAEQDVVLQDEVKQVVKIADAGKILRVITCAEIKPNDVNFDTMNVPKADFALKDNVGFQLNPSTPEAHKDFITRFVLNCLNFVNDPEIEWIDIPMDVKRNAKRVKNNKFPIGPRRKVKITGKVKRYTQHLEGLGESRYSHRFFVRGHWRTLRAERYGANRGKKIWVPPHTRGEGILVEKTYNLKG